MTSFPRPRPLAAIMLTTLLVVDACAGSAGTAPAAATPARTTAQPAPSDPADMPRAALDLELGDVVASGEITPLDGGHISGEDADGARYTLDVEPLAVSVAVTVDLRPLHGSTDLGAVIAGADLSPAGLQLMRPAVLSIDGVVMPPAWAAFEYRGDASGASGRLAIDPPAGPDTVRLLMSHFSGSVAVDVGSNAGQLYDKWTSTRGDDSPTGRQAVAEARYAAADLAERAGTISSETANGIRDRASSDWMAAEGDRLANDPDMLQMANGGRPEDLDALAAEVSRIVDFQARLETAGVGSASPGLASAVEVLSRYEAAIVKNVVDSAEVQAAARSGLVSDVGQIEDLVQLVLGIERQIQLLGGPPSAAMAKVIDLMIAVRDALLKSCAQAPLDPALILGLERQLELLSVPEVSMAELETCWAEPPGPTSRPVARRIEGRVTWDATSDDFGIVDRYQVVLDLVILEDSIGDLAFGSGSRMSVSWTGQPAFDCPASGTGSGTVGTPSGDGINEVSDPHPDTIGLVTELASGDLGLRLGTVGAVYAQGEFGECRLPGLTIACDDPGHIVGRLVGATPREWVFSCTATQDSVTSTTGGHLTQTR